MARYRAANCRLCRREGEKLYLKGDRCYESKCGFERKRRPPGPPPQRRGKISDYGLQLREKQKAKRFYGLLEKQFRNLFERASKQHGITGENLLKMLELRMDNIIYRLGFAASRKEARQLVTHGHFLVNDKRVDIPSIQLKAGDVITVKEKSRKSPKFSVFEESTFTTPVWLSSNPKTYTGEIVAEPKREDIEAPIAEHLIVELYSK